MKHIVYNTALMVFIFFMSIHFTPARADIITLKNGKTYEGVIGAQDNEIILLSVPGQMPLKIYRSSIRSIEKGAVKSKEAINQSNTVADLKFLSCGEYYKELTKALKGAKKSIQVMMFYINYKGLPGYPITQLIDLLVDAHKRKVKVEVLLETSSEENITRANRKTADYLVEKGIDVRFYPVYPVMHTKLVIVDNNISILGSHNWTMAATKKNVESSVLIESQRVAKKFKKYFRSNFNRAKPYRGGKKHVRSKL